MHLQRYLTFFWKTVFLHLSSWFHKHTNAPLFCTRILERRPLLRNMCARCFQKLWGRSHRYACSCQTPTIGSRCSALGFTTSVFSCCRAAFRFLNPAASADGGSEGEAGSESQNRWLWLNQRWLDKWSPQSLDTLVFIFTPALICFSYQHVYNSKAGLMFWSQEDRVGRTDPTTVCCWSLNHWKSFLYSIMRGGGKREDIKDLELVHCE